MASSSSRSATPSFSTPPSTPPEVADASRCSSHHKVFAGSQHQRWRPSFHLQPPSGWLNDPCAPFYDSTTGLYHVSFQWNPNGPDWGDISWGSATSPDMVNWTVQGNPVLSPSTDYDAKGVFTGCFIHGQDDALTYAYTSVGSLPIHHTIPHPRGCESLSLAKSYDAGRTWEKVPANPILPCEPEGLDVTGWRDPYVSRWPAMAKMLDVEEDNALFGIISGGIRDVTPTTFLYAIDAADLRRWTYLGSLVNLGLNFRPSHWSGDLGRNWEVTNFLSIRDEIDPSVTREVLVMGTEGCLEDDSASDLQTLSRPVRGQLWMSGNLHREAQSGLAPQMSYNFGGHLDHGCFYAANSFFDPQIQKPVVWGWIPEDDLCDELRHAQGWSGMLSTPRELRMQTLQHVIGTSRSRLQDITSIEVEDDEHGSSTVRTLGIEPLHRLVHSLRQGVKVSYTRLDWSKLGFESQECGPAINSPKTDRWEIRCSIRMAIGCRKAGIRIGHSPSFDSSTTLSFEPSQETFTIERPTSAGLSKADSSKFINSMPEKAPHTLFTTRDPLSGIEETEPLELCAWRDNSVLEVFVNGRTAISTRLYAADETFGAEFFADGEGAELLSAEVWDNIEIPTAHMPAT